MLYVGFVWSWPTRRLTRSRSNVPAWISGIHHLASPLRAISQARMATPGRVGRGSRRGGKLRGSRAEQRWQRMHCPCAASTLGARRLRFPATMGLGRVRAPNLGPIWAQRPRLAITERLLAIGRLLHPRSLETHRQIPADLGVKRAAAWRLRRPPPVGVVQSMRIALLDLRVVPRQVVRFAISKPF
jgi:hypothetical protein